MGKIDRCALSILALLAASQGNCLAQESDCSAKVKITSLGTPRITENVRSMMSSVGPYRYRLDATSDEKQCFNLNFSLVLRFMNKDHQPDVAVYPASMRIRGGEGTEYGDLPGRREDSKARVTVETIVCKRC